jgi:hypothetical protein
VWAFAGIYVKQSDTQVVAITALLLALVLLVLLAVNLVRGRLTAVPAEA